MQVDLDNLFQVLLYALGFFALYYGCYRKFIYSIFDPLFIYVFTISFASVLVVLVLEDRPADLINFFLCQLFLFVGFVLTHQWSKRWKIKSVKLLSVTELYDYSTLRLTIQILFVVYLLANIVLFFTTGFAFLSDDPTTAKVDNFAKGFGIILKINWGIGGFLGAGLLFLILSKRTWTDVAMLLVLVFFTSLEGSKSSLLRVLIAFALLINHQFFSGRKRAVRQFNMIAPIGLVILLTVFFGVFIKENSDTEQAFFSFVRRLLYGADSILFYYNPVNEQYFSRYHSWEFPGHLFNQILGFLRLVTVQEALGNIMVENALPNSNLAVIVGPNTPFYIEGQVYFGYYGALFYSLAVGGVYCFIREYYFKAQYYSAFWFVLVCCICQQAYSLSIEVTLFLTQAFDTCFFVLPVYVLTSLFLHGRLLVRKLHF